MSIETHTHQKRQLIRKKNQLSLFSRRVMRLSCIATSSQTHAKRDLSCKKDFLLKEARTCQEREAYIYDKRPIKKRPENINNFFSLFLIGFCFRSLFNMSLLIYIVLCRKWIRLIYRVFNTSFLGLFLIGLWFRSLFNRSLVIYMGLSHEWIRFFSRIFFASCIGLLSYIYVSFNRSLI